MLETIVNLIANYSDIPVYIVVGYGLLVYRELPESLKPFCWFLFLSGIVQLASSILFHYRINNMPALHIYVIAGFICLIIFYKKLLKGFISDKILNAIGVSFVLFSLINSLFVQPALTYNSYALTVESILIIILSISTFLLMMNDIVRDQKEHLIKSVNWINSGLFIYYTSSLLVFYFGNMITQFDTSELTRYTWVIHALFSIIMYICFFIGLWKRPKRLIF